MPCEFSYDTQHSTVRNAFLRCAAKAEILDDLEERSGQLERLSWTALVTGCLLERGVMGGFLAFHLACKSATIYGIGSEIVPLRYVKGFYGTY